MNVVGLGSAGCSVAAEFAKYPQYKAYYIDFLTGCGKDFSRGLRKQGKTKEGLFR
jgi:hypothetical protein